MLRLAHVFFDVDMRRSHPGLLLLATQKRVNLVNMGKDECALFLNKSQTRVKLFAGGTECIIYVAKNTRFDAETIQVLPHYVEGANLDLNAAVRAAILKRVTKKGQRVARKN